MPICIHFWNLLLSIAIQPSLAANTVEAAFDTALASAGIPRVGSYQAAATLRSGAVKRLLTTFEREPIPVSLLYAGQPYLPRKLRTFLDFATPGLTASVATASEF